MFYDLTVAKQKEVKTAMIFNSAKLVSRLEKAADGEVKTNELLAPYTSYKIGGPSAIWVAPETEEGIRKVLEILHESEVPLFILGRGSNLLISDRGWQGVTLYLGKNLSGWIIEGREAEALAGTLLMDLINATAERGLTGMELLAGIPGGLGGALRMNAGAFGQEIESATLAVRGFCLDGSPFEVRGNQVDFAYRRAPRLEEVVITAARLAFKRETTAVLRERIRDILALRAKKQPLAYPSCGSVFKRPPGYYAGALIEAAGLKGERIGGAIVSRKHAGFILNAGNASASDVYALIRRIEERVWERFGVKLKREVKLIGQFEY
jgi:UDP-N-acetylmuramate dehydrogenase